MKRETIIGKTILFTVCIVIMAFSTFEIASAAISVVRDLPHAVSPGQEFNVSLTQSGFVLNAGYVTETLPAGFTYVWGSLPSDTADYDEETNNLTITFSGETTITYLVAAGTVEEIENAVFSGTWTACADIQLEIRTGEIAGDTRLTLMAFVIPLPEFADPPTDPNEDGLYEDLNGNGGLDFNDVVQLFKYLEWIEANEPIACFDFNGNGRLDFADIVQLFKEV